MIQLLQRLSCPTRWWCSSISPSGLCTYLSARVDSPDRTASPSARPKDCRQTPSQWWSYLTRQNRSTSSSPYSSPQWSFFSWPWQSLRSSSSATKLRISPSFQQDSQIVVSWSSSCRRLLWRQKRWEGLGLDWSSSTIMRFPYLLRS